MSRSVVLVVTEDSQGDRLDHFLGAYAPDLSRTRAKDIILSGITVGIGGYAIGNYLGILIAELLFYFG